MGRRGPKPKTGKITWSADLAYAVGLLATDGCLSTTGRHIIFVSKDPQQIQNLMLILDLHVSIGSTTSGYSGRKTARIQFGDVVLYRFLLNIGLTPNKSKTLGVIKIPRKYFFDFLRGSFDGDGSSYSYWDPRWRSSFMFYTTFVSASRTHITWLQDKIFHHLNVRGHITYGGNHAVYQLKYAKADSLKILRKMYYAEDVVCLSRKRLKIKKMLAIVGEQL